MPNHVTNIIEAPKEVLDYLRPTRPATEEHFGRDDACDFDRVIPMPHWAHPRFTATRSVHRNDKGEITATGYGLDGYSPFDWARNWWGTKWNAYSVVRDTDTVLRFETAWAHPDPVILVLSRLFPEATIRVKYADEDLGHNFGEYTITNGEIAAADLPGDGSPEALDFAARLVYGVSYAELQADEEEEAAS